MSGIGVDFVAGSIAACTLTEAGACTGEVGVEIWDAQVEGSAGLLPAVGLDPESEEKGDPWPPEGIAVTLPPAISAGWSQGEGPCV